MQFNTQDACPALHATWSSRYIQSFTRVQTCEQTTLLLLTKNFILMFFSGGKTTGGVNVIPRTFIARCYPAQPALPLIWKSSGQGESIVSWVAKLAPKFITKLWQSSFWTRVTVQAGPGQAAEMVFTNDWERTSAVYISGSALICLSTTNTADNVHLLGENCCIQFLSLPPGHPFNLYSLISGCWLELEMISGPGNGTARIWINYDHSEENWKVYLLQFKSKLTEAIDHPNCMVHQRQIQYAIN